PPIRNANNFRSNFVPALSAEDLGFAKMKFIEFVQKVNAALDESSMPEMKVFQSKFIESENPKEALHDSDHKAIHHQHHKTPWDGLETAPNELLIHYIHQS
ncbi:hypothetical protein, partial [Gelidibacter salicanalis]